uniref:Uncharacterized protein n=1 Tax=Anopheles stephensi TaxID=30069 RepID=A0A182YDW4_ANOST
MSVFNLGVVFGPTLLRAAEETVAAILDIKFNNVIIEILIENYDKIFKNIPSTLAGGGAGESYIRVRTLYACLAENDGELSFEPNQIITNGMYISRVRRSNEPGWLEGTLNGKSGLIPENYVEILK